MTLLFLQRKSFETLCLGLELGIVAKSFKKVIRVQGLLSFYWDDDIVFKNTNITGKLQDASLWGCLFLVCCFC